MFLYAEVPPTGIEPISAEPESAILSIELRRQGKLWMQRCNFFTVNTNFQLIFRRTIRLADALRTAL